MISHAEIGQISLFHEIHQKHTLTNGSWALSINTVNTMFTGNFRFDSKDYIFILLCKAELPVCLSSEKCIILFCSVSQYSKRCLTMTAENDICSVLHRFQERGNLMHVVGMQSQNDRRGRGLRGVKCPPPLTNIFNF